MLRTQIARALAVVPVLFALVYTSCPSGGSGFALSLHVGELHLAASTCRG